MDTSHRRVRLARTGEPGSNGKGSLSLVVMGINRLMNDDRLGHAFRCFQRRADSCRGAKNESWKQLLNACVSGPNLRSRCHASPTLMGVTLSVTVRVSMRLPSSDQRWSSRFERIATPLPLATMLHTGSTELVTAWFGATTLGLALMFSGGGLNSCSAPSTVIVAYASQASLSHRSRLRLRLAK